jgi:hypothetical protein
MNVVSVALSNYDRQKKKYKALYKPDVTIHFDTSSTSELDLPKCTFKTGDKVVAHGTYNIIGYYFKEEQHWVWGWNTLYTEKHGVSFRNRALLSRQIVNYALNIVYQDTSDLEKQEQRRIKAFFFQLHQDLLSNTKRIQHPVQLEKYLAISQYITHSDMVYRFNDPSIPSVVFYLLIKDLQVT